MEFQAVSGPKFTGLFSLNAGGIAIVCNAADFGYRQPFRRFAIKIRSGPKLTEILHVFDPNFFFFWGGGALPEFLEWDYKLQTDSDHVAKFQGDRSRELGERVAKKRKKDTSRIKHTCKPVRNGGSGRPNEL